ncbi:mycofactocin-coupled SDR family oxidoreductase [Jatrophihabitans fulvus]
MTEQGQRLAGKVAFITGVARGQGRSHAIRLAQEGADIIGVDACADIATVGYEMATAEDMQATVEAVEALDRRIVTSQVDIRDSAGLTKAVDEGVAQLGRLDIVIANAGIAAFVPVEDMTDEQWDEMIAINLSGQFRSVRPAIPHLKKNSDGGAIVFTSSTAGLKGMANIAHYSAAKHGLVGLAKSMAIELAEHRIRVNTVHPTNVHTRMIHNPFTYRVFFPDRDPSTVTREEAGPMLQTLNLIPEPAVDPEDISEAILYLVADSGRYVTGIQLPVDLGMVTK